jgi:hypothetical protein
MTHWCSVTEIYSVISFYLKEPLYFNLLLHLLCYFIVFPVISYVGILF